MEILTFNNPGAAVAAVEGLIKIGKPAVAPLLANLDQYNYGARAWAVRVLAGIGDVRGLAVLEQALAEDVVPSVRRAAARGLGQLVLDGLGPEEREEATLRCLPPWRRAKAMASGSFATPLRQAWNNSHRLSLAIQTW